MMDSPEGQGLRGAEESFGVLETTAYLVEFATLS